MTTKQHGGLRNPPGGRPPKDHKQRGCRPWVPVENDEEEAAIKAMTPAERRERLLTRRPAPPTGAEGETRCTK